MKNLWRFIYGLLLATNPIAVIAYNNGLAMRALGMKSEFLDEIEKRTL